MTALLSCRADKQAHYFIADPPRFFPCKITLASFGFGTTWHVTGELFKMMSGINMLHVPYRGSAPMVTDLIGGQMQTAFDNLPASIEHIRAGKVRALAVTTGTRSESLPDIPIVADVGLRGERVGGPRCAQNGAANLVGRFLPVRGLGEHLAGSYDSTPRHCRGSNGCNIFPPSGLTDRQRAERRRPLLFFVDCEVDAVAL